MDELPPEARHLLALAKDEHDPIDLQARARVRRAVAVSVTAGAGAAVAGKAVAQGAAKVGLWSGLGAKVVGASLAVVTAGALAMHSAGPPPSPPVSDARKAQVARIDRGAELPEAERPAPANVNAADPFEAQAGSLAPHETAATHDGPALDHPAATRGPARHARRTLPKVSRLPERHSADSLRAEMALLKAASAAIERMDAPAATALLAEHAQRFVAPMLLEERQGLSALLACTKHTAGARRQAQRFLSTAPRSVLARRIQNACALTEDQP